MLHIRHFSVTYVWELVCRGDPPVPGDVVDQLRGELDVDNSLELQIFFTLLLSAEVNLIGKIDSVITFH